MMEVSPRLMISSIRPPRLKIQYNMNSVSRTSCSKREELREPVTMNHSIDATDAMQMSDFMI